jgi:predicted ferric reductase
MGGAYKWELVMDWLDLLERYGIPLVVAAAFWFFIQKQNKFIQDELQKELRESFDRIENIIIKLIDQQKKMQLGQRGLERSYKALIEIIARLSGNGLKDKLMRMQEKDEV